MPDNFEVLQFLGISYKALKDYTNAQQVLKKAVDQKPGYNMALEGLVHIFMETNREDDAVRLVKKQLAIHPDSPNLLLLYGSLLFNKQKYKEGLVVFRKVQEIAPEIPAAYMMEALSLKALGEFEEVIATRYRDLAHEENVTPESQMVLAALLEISGDIEGAMDAYRRVLELSPKFAPAANNLAWLIANDETSNLEEASNLALVAKDQLPNDPYIADTFGWVQHRQGHHYLAAIQFQQAISESPNTPVYYFHLALAFEGQDKKEEAINSVKQSLKLSRSFPERDQAEALYKKLTGRDFK